MRLMREIRFSVGPAAEGPVSNSWAGWPAATGIQPWLVLRARVEGEPDPATGYVCNIAMIDRLLRERSIPLVNRIVRGAGERASATGEVVIRAIADNLLGRAPAGTRWVDWQLGITPFVSYTVNAGALDMVHVSERFEFAASHRLHCPSMSERENRETFGKCNNPRGHGHNYEVEVTVAGEPEAASGVLLPLARIESVVKQRIIERFDHKHLNEDCAEFADLNPSVENITRVIWSLLEGQFGPARLAKVRVWETPKTYAEYEG